MSARHKLPDLSIAAAITLYLDSLISQGRRRATICTKKRQLRRLFGPALGEPLRTLSADRLQHLLRSLAAVRSKKTGAPLASETLCFCRESARSFTRWCAAQGRLSADPMMGADKSFAWLSSEATQLRADLAALRQERDHARQQHTGECSP